MVLVLCNARKEQGLISMGGLVGSAVRFVLSLVGLSFVDMTKEEKKRRIAHWDWPTRFFSLTKAARSAPRWALLPPSRRCCGCRGGLMLPYRGEQLIVRLELIIERPLRRIARAVRLEVVDDIRK